MSGAVTSDNDGVGTMLCCGHKNVDQTMGDVILVCVEGKGKDNSPGISYSYSLILTRTWGGPFLVL